MRMWKSSGIEAVATISVWLSAAGTEAGVQQREVVVAISSLFLLLFARPCVGTNVRM